MTSGTAAIVARSCQHRGVHVLYVLDRFPVVSETFVAHEAQAIRRGGDAVTIAVRRPGQGDRLVHPIAAALAPCVIELPPAGGAWRAVPRMLARRPRATFRTLLWALRIRIGERGALRAFADGCWLAAGPAARADHVHAHFAHGSATAALVAGRLAGRPASFTGHSSDLFGSIPPWVLASKVRRARPAVTVCEATREYVRRAVGGGPAQRVVVVRNGVDPDFFPPRLREPSGSPVVLAVARLVDMKGIDVLVRAARLSDPGIRWVVIGEGPRRAELEELARSLGVAERVRFRGATEQAAVRDALDGATVLVCPSRQAGGEADAVPVVLTEAMSVGVSVVATPVWGIPEVVQDERTGLLVGVDDPTALAAAVERLIADGELRARVVTAGRRVAADHDVDRAAATLRAWFAREVA